MKTLTEKYNAVLEGTFPKKQFVRDARLFHPNFITQFTSFGDAVKILKNKGLIYESISMHDLELPMVLESSLEDEIANEEFGMDYDQLGPGEQEWVRDEIENMRYENKKEQTTQESSDTYTSSQVMAMAKKAGDFVLDARDSLRGLAIGYGDSIPKERVLQILSHYDLELEDVTGSSSSETHPTDGHSTDTEISYWMLEAKKDKENATTVQNLPPSTLDKAIKYELEKAGVDYLMAAPETDEYLKAKEKAEKALAKDRLYYLELDTTKKKRTDLMEPVTAKNVVDKGNEMKKVKINEMKKVIKALIVKSLNEESQIPKSLDTRLEANEQELSPIQALQESPAFERALRSEDAFANFIKGVEADLWNYMASHFDNRAGAAPDEL